MDIHVVGEGPPPGARAKMWSEDEQTARRMLRTFKLAPADLDDLTQEVMIALHAGRAGFRVPVGRARGDAWRSFVWGVVVRQVASFRRARARRRTGEQGAGENHESIAPSTEDRVLAESSRLALREAACALAPPHRAVMELFLSGLSISEVAAKLEIPPGTAWTRFRHAKEALRAVVVGTLVAAAQNTNA